MMLDPFPFQSGYRKSHSTQTALLKLTDDIREGMDQQHVTLLLLFDFSKAFDSVCHATLLHKLRDANFAVSAIKWIASYLTGREQAVLDNDGVPSPFTPLNKGVPQGSVLGPLLFSLYINDIAAGFNSSVLHIIYADDLQLYVRFPLYELQHYTTVMSQYGEQILEWATQNKLLLNVGKTKAIIVGSYYYIDRLSRSEIEGVTVNGTLIKFESSVRNLGVVLDCRLNWKEHVSTICRKSYSLLYRLNFFRKATNEKLRKHLIESLLFPLIDYCSLVLCDLSNELDLKIQRVINSGIRYIFGIRKSAHISPYRSSLGWLTTKRRRDYFSIVLLYKLFKIKSPSYLFDRYIVNQSTRPVRGQRPPLCIPPFKKEFLQKSFYVSSSYLWNSLPSVIRDNQSLKSFKNCIHSYLLSLEVSHTSLLQAHL